MYNISFETQFILYKMGLCIYNLSYLVLCKVLDMLAHSEGPQCECLSLACHHQQLLPLGLRG